MDAAQSELKPCTCCGEPKPEDQFYFRKDRNRLVDTCKACWAAKRSSKDKRRYAKRMLAVGRACNSPSAMSIAFNQWRNAINRSEQLRQII